MTSRDEARAKCIEVIGTALIATEDSGDVLVEAAAAFDALHGLARVVPVEATEKMVAAVAYGTKEYLRHVEAMFETMSTAGDLTNPPETKP